MKPIITVSRRPIVAPGRLVIDLRRHTFRVDDVSVYFRPVSFRAHQCLSSAYPRLVGFSEAMDFVYGDDIEGGPDKGAAALGSLIAKTAHKLSPLGLAVESFFGMGWRLVEVPACERRDAA